MPVAFTWKVLKAIRKQSYIKNHLQSLVKWIRHKPSTSRPSCGMQGQFPGAGAACLGQPTALLGPPHHGEQQSQVLPMLGISLLLDLKHTCRPGVAEVALTSPAAAAIAYLPLCALLLQ